MLRGWLSWRRSWTKRRESGVGFILLNPPRDANKSVRGMEAWLTELDVLLERHGYDPEIRAQIEHERWRSEAILTALRNREGEQSAGGTGEGNGGA